MSEAKQLNRQQQIAIMKQLRQGAAGWLLKTHVRQLRDTDCPRNDDGSYNARDVIQWHVQRSTDTDDPLLAGGDSPNLERYRAARADLAEMEAAERRGHLVDIDSFMDWWDSEVATPIRRSIETLRKLAPDAAAIVVKALEKAEANVQKRSKRRD